MKKLAEIIDRNRANPTVSDVEELLGIVRGFAAEEIDKGLVQTEKGNRGLSFHFLIPILGVDLLFLAFGQTISVYVRTESVKKYHGYDLVKSPRGTWFIHRFGAHPLDADTFDEMVADIVEHAPRG